MLLTHVINIVLLTVTTLYTPIRTNPEEDALQIHTDGEIPGENLETNIRRSNRNSKKTE